MDIFKIAAGIYGVLMVVGGFMGYIKARSKVSLVMGIISGIIIFVGVYFLTSDFIMGRMIISGVSGILFIVFVKRFLKTRSFMPSGLLLLLSLCIFILFVANMFII